MWLLGSWMALTCLRMVLASASENPERKCFIISVSTFASLTACGQGSRTSAATNCSRSLAFLMPLASNVPSRSTLLVMKCSSAHEAPLLHLLCDTHHTISPLCIQTVGKVDSTACALPRVETGQLQRRFCLLSLDWSGHWQSSRSDPMARP